MRALIIGASGQVGGTLAALCVRRRIEVYGTSRKGQGFLYLDLADPAGGGKPSQNSGDNETV